MIGLEMILVIGFVFAIGVQKAVNEVTSNSFVQEEAKRMIEKDCEVDGNWNSRGRIYCTGLKFTKNEKGEVIPINQAKLYGLGRVS